MSMKLVAPFNNDPNRDVLGQMEDVVCLLASSESTSPPPIPFRSSFTFDVDFSRNPGIGF